jgi:hypothetical protein
MKRILLLLFFISCGIFANSQDFKQAVGIRLGWSPGFEYRIFSNDLHSYKFLLSTRDHGVQLHLFKEFHQYDMFTFTDQLVFFYGAGVHAGYERWDVIHYNNNSQWYDTHSAFLAGLDGLVGLEYFFNKAPISLGIEAKPYFEFFGQEFFDIQLFDFGFTVKYLF